MFFTNISTMEWGVYTSKICKPSAGGLHGGFTSDNIAGPYGTIVPKASKPSFHVDIKKNIPNLFLLEVF